MTKQFNSSQLKEGSYNHETKVLTITFNTGKSYEYYDVPESVWDRLCAAESAGKFLNSEVKGKFQYKQI